MPRFTVRPRQYTKCYAFIYTLNELGEIYRFFSGFSGRVTMTVSGADDLSISLRDSVMGETDEWTLKPLDVIVYDGNTIKVMNEKKFNELYERAP